MESRHLLKGENSFCENFQTKVAKFQPLPLLVMLHLSHLRIHFIIVIMYLKCKIQDSEDSCMVWLISCVQEGFCSYIQVIITSV